MTHRLQFRANGVLLWLLLLAVPVVAQTKINELKCRVRSTVEWDIHRSNPGRIHGPNPQPIRPRMWLEKTTMEVYDRKRRLILYVAYKSDGGILYADKNIYDVQGRLIRTETLHSEHVYLPDLQLYSYDQKGRLSEVKGYDAAGQLLGGHLYRYDDSDNLLEERSYSSGKNLVYSNHVRKSEQPATKTYSIKHDVRGNTVEETERSLDGRISRRVTYTYVFDHYGNWVRSVRHEWKAEGVGSVFEPITRTVRKIEYYRNPCRK